MLSVRGRDSDPAATWSRSPPSTSNYSGGALMKTELADMAVAQATVETGLTAATFQVAATISADGTAQKVTITTLTPPACATTPPPNTSSRPF